MADPKAPPNNAQNARETTSSSRRGKDAAIIDMLNKSIADADGKSDVNAAEKVAQDYVKEKSYSMKRFFEAHPEKAAAYAKELAQILSKYNGDVKQVHVFCEMAWKKLEGDLSVTFREGANDFLDVGRNHCITLKETDYNPRKFNDIKNTTQYLGHITKDEGQRVKYAKYLWENPEDAKKFLSFWDDKDNPVRYLMAAQPNGEQMVASIDRFKEEVRANRRKNIVDTIDRKGNTNSEQVAKVVQVLSDKNGVDQIINTMGSSAEATESLLFAFAGPNAKGMAELRKLPNGDELANKVTEAIKTGLKKFYRINTEAGWLDRIGPKGTMEIIARQIVFGSILLRPLSASGQSARLVSMMKYLPELKTHKQIDDIIAQYNPNALNNPDYQAQLYLFLRIFHNQYAKQEGAAKIGVILSTIEAKHVSKFTAAEMNAIVTKDSINWWQKVKAIFAREANSVSIFDKATNLFTEDNEYSKGYSIENKKIAANEEKKDKSLERVWVDVDVVGKQLANLSANEINLVTLRNYVRYLNETKKPVANTLMHDFLNGWNRIDAFGKLQELGGLVGIDVLTGKDIPSTVNRDGREDVKNIFKRDLQPQIKIVAESLIKDHIKDAEGIIAQNLSSENQSALKAEFANFEKKAPTEQQQFIVWVITKYIPDRNKRFDIIKQIFNGRAEGVKQNGKMEQEALKNSAPSSDLKKTLKEMGIITTAITSEQTKKVEKMLATLQWAKQDDKTKSDCKYLTYLLNIHNHTQQANGNVAIAYNPSKISSQKTVKEAQATAKVITDMAHAKTDEDSSRTNINAYLVSIGVKPDDTKKIEELAKTDKTMQQMLRDVAIASARQTRLAQENPEEQSMLPPSSFQEERAPLRDLAKKYTKIDEKNVEEVVKNDNRSYFEHSENATKRTISPNTQVLQGNLTTKIDALVVDVPYKWSLTPGFEITRKTNGDVKIGDDLVFSPRELPVAQKAIRSLDRIGAMDLLPLLPELLIQGDQSNVFADGKFGENEQKQLFETIARVFLPKEKQKEIDIALEKSAVRDQSKALSALIVPPDTSKNYLRESLNNRKWRSEEWKLQNLDEIRAAITKHRNPEKQKS